MALRMEILKSSNTFESTVPETSRETPQTKVLLSPIQQLTHTDKSTAPSPQIYVLSGAGGAELHITQPCVSDSHGVIVNVACAAARARSVNADA